MVQIYIYLFIRVISLWSVWRHQYMVIIIKHFIGSTKVHICV